MVSAAQHFKFDKISSNVSLKFYLSITLVNIDAWYPLCIMTILKVCCEERNQRCRDIVGNLRGWKMLYCSKISWYLQINWINKTNSFE